MIRLYGKVDDQKYDYQCDLVSRTDKEIILTTRSHPPHNVRLIPAERVPSPVGEVGFYKFVKSRPIICDLFFDGKWLASANFCEEGNGMQIGVIEPCAPRRRK